MASVVTWLRLALRRMGEERGLVLAAAAVAFVAATVAAACVIYPDAAIRRGLLAVLGGADPLAARVTVATDVPPARAAEIDAAVTAGLAEALGTANGTTIRTGRSESWALPGGDDLRYPPLVTFAWDDGLRDRVTLVDGAWPGPGDDDTVDVVITTGAADHLEATPGSMIVVTSRQDPSRRLTARVSGIVRILDPGDPAWGADPLLLEGAAEPGSFPLRGPFFVERDVLLDRVAGRRVTLGWQAVPAYRRIGPEDVGAVAAGVRSLGDRLEERIGTERAITVATDLPALLERAGAGVLAGRSGTTLVAAQVLVLAGYAVVLLAALVVEQRRVTAAMTAARGGGTGVAVGLAALEGALVALPGVVLGPPVALLLVDLLLPPAGPGAPAARLLPAAVGLSVAAGVAVVAGMILPTLAATSPLRRLRRLRRGRGEAGLAERSGIDLALLVLAAIALWQLRENGAPIARSAGGALGIDPLLAAAPAVGLLAGGLLALRLGPLLGAWLERLAGDRAGPVGTLAACSIGRRSPEMARATLLLVVATGIALFAAAYGRTWERSQEDQVAAALPADLVGTVGDGDGAGDARSTRAAALAIAGVEAAAPATRGSFAVGDAVSQGTLVAVPAQAIEAFAGGRDERPPTQLRELAARLDAGRPDVVGLDVPADATSLRVTVDVAIGTTSPSPAIPATWRGLRGAVVVRDGLGGLHRIEGATGSVTGGRQALDVRLAEPAGADVAGLQGPLRVVAVELELTLPGMPTDGELRLLGVDAGTAMGATGERWGALDLAPAQGGWSAAWTAFGRPATALPSRAGPGLGTVVDEEATAAAPIVVAFRPDALAALADASVPIIVDRATAGAVGVAPGDEIALRRGLSTVLRARVAGVLEVLPGIAPGRGGAYVDLGTLALQDYARDGTLPAATEWWLDTSPAAAAISPGVVAERLGLREVRSRAAELASRLDDPLALATRGALGLVGAAAIVFGCLGFAAAARQAVRSRRSELAVARALGVRRGEAATWLGLEVAFQLGVGIAGGLVLGIALAWAVLPSVTLTPDGSAPVPGPEVVVPWDLALIAVAAGIAALVAAAPALLRVGRPGALAAELREAAEA